MAKSETSRRDNHIGTNAVATRDSALELKTTQQLSLREDKIIGE